MNNIIDIYNSFFLNNKKLNFNIIFDNKVNLNYIENFIKSNNLDNNILFTLNYYIKRNFYYIIDNLETLDNTFFLIHFIKNNHVKIRYEYTGSSDAFGFNQYNKIYDFNNNNTNIYHMQILCYHFDNNNNNLKSKINILYEIYNNHDVPCSFYNYYEFVENNKKKIKLNRKKTIINNTKNFVLRKIKLFLVDLFY